MSCRVPIIVIMLVMGMTFLSCNKGEGDVFPSLLQEYVLLSFGETGKPDLLQNDKQKSYVVKENKSSVLPYPILGSLRVIANYELVDENSVRLYSWTPVLVLTPQNPASIPEEVGNTPLHLLSGWLANGFINLNLSIKAQNKMHELACVEVGFQTTSTRNIIELVILHDKVGDLEAYHKRLYVSIPIQHYLEAGKESVFVLKTLNYDGYVEENYFIKPANLSF